MNNPIITSAFSDYAYTICTHLITIEEEEISTKIDRLAEVYQSFLVTCCMSSGMFFGSDYQRTVYVINHYQLPYPIAKRLKFIGFVVKKKKIPTPADKLSMNFIYALEALIQSVAFCSETELPETLANFVEEQGENSFINYEEPPNELSILDATIVRKGDLLKTKDGQKNYFILFCHSPRFGDLKIAVWEPFQYLHSLIWNYSRVNFVKIIREKKYFQDEPIDEAEAVADESTVKNIPIFSTTTESQVVLDPDYLFDATTIRQGYCKGGPDSRVYICKKFEISPPNYYFLRGSVVNDYLDYLIAEIPITPDQLIQNYLQAKPSIALFLNEDEIEKLKRELVPHFATLQNQFLPKYKKSTLRVEPTFISEIYGIRGRLDVLVEYPEQPNRHDIIELKTSKDPIAYGSPTNQADAAQAICYNLLLNTIHPNQTGSSAILYSNPKAQYSPFRNVTNDAKSQQNILKLRNGIVALEYRLCNNPRRLLDAVRAENINKYMWDNEHVLLKTFAYLRDNLSPLEKNYFDEFIRFISKEKRATKVGGNQLLRSGFSSLWNHTLSEKEKRFAILSNLTFNKIDAPENDLSSFKKIHLNKSDKTLSVSVFRKGDMVLIYPQEDDGSLRPTRHQIIKASVRKITPNEVVITAYNPHIENAYFNKYENWVLEREHIDRSFDAMYASMMQFITAPKAKRNLLLGLNPPSFKENFTIDQFFGPLTMWQQQLVTKALSSNNYYLLQGPPGTGKTSFVLREIVWQLLKNPEEKILLLAYTNRAVDEICKSLKSINPVINFSRLGNSNTTEYPEVLLSKKITGKSINEVKQIWHNCPVYVSTVLGIQSHWELFDHLHFTTAIVDEASQLLEPQVTGILSRVKKFILIGDEKQLPAVVVQSASPIAVEDENLQEIGLHFLNNSLFERLVKLSDKNGWDASEMLQEQGRMHLLVQDFPNVAFYQNRLKVINEAIQTLPQPKALKATTSPFLKLLAQKRRLFIPSPAAADSKVHPWEANTIAQLINQLREFYEPEDIGVITPYRAQIGKIRQKLKGEDNAVTIDTVERYQGGQRSVILVSFAVNHSREMDFLVVADDTNTIDRKLNVALTRAKELLILVGCPFVLNHHPIYERLLQYFKEKELWWEMEKETNQVINIIENPANDKAILDDLFGGLE